MLSVLYFILGAATASIIIFFLPIDHNELRKLKMENNSLRSKIALYDRLIRIQRRQRDKRAKIHLVE